MNTIEKHRAFLGSLDGEKGLPEEMHGWRFDEPLELVCNGRDRMSMENFKAYILERCRRAESRQIPDLKEKVKELVRDAIDVAANHDDKWNYCTLIKEFRALCEPEKDSKEVAR